ncbi:MAG: hypothetical protein QNJ12_02545 [Ilumatobacter sp.]|uniref:nuclear transport factor 2 family protein n=1 Tax=Ilumatobacter sp. TaxID=1967498 RepID=UPI00262D65EA|nr:nuclear transport factor 2 family protein [Ilumatobacter sp.]MDJ0767637.1 hypothetical protein [Ilumatobacter sp.]
MSTGRDFLDRYYQLLGAGDIDGVVAMYEPGAEIVRYDGVAGTPDEIGGYFRTFLAQHPGFALRSVDQLREHDDVLMWDALVDTDNGLLQTVHVVTLGEHGLIRRHIPGMRGYWGR